MNEIIKTILAPYPQIKTLHIMVQDNMSVMITGFNREGFDSFLWNEANFKDRDKSLIVTLDLSSRDLEHITQAITVNLFNIISLESTRRLEARDGAECFTLFPDGSLECHKGRLMEDLNSPINFLS